MARRVKACLIERKENEAFQIVVKHKDVLKWIDERWYNFTLMHYAARDNCNTFLVAVFGEEEVVIFSELAFYITL